MHSCNLRPSTSNFRPPTSGLWLLASGLWLLTSCRSVGPDYQKPEVVTPTAFKNAAPTSEISNSKSQITDSWWLVFNDPALNELETATLTQSPQLAAALARLDEARARLGTARSDRQPSLTTNTTARLAGETSERVLPVPPRPITYRDSGDSYRVPFDAAYEIDLWGRVRRSVEAAGAQAQASEQDLAALRLSLTAEVAQAWFSLRALDTETEILERTLELRNEQITIHQKRLDAGLTTELDLQRARAEAASAEAELADLRRRRELTANALAVLTGAAPSDFKTPATTALAAPPAIPVGLPSGLLQRRPDVFAAERLLAARTAEIGVAKAAFFPTLRLTGSAGFESGDLRALVDRPSQFWQIGPSISYPILDGGRNKANLQAAEARTRAAFADYQQKILVAFRETEDALVDLRQQAEQTAAITRALDASTTAAALSTTRYEKGLVNYLEVIDAQRSQLGAERTLIQLTSARQISTIRLIKALGGGWAPRKE